MCYKQVKTNFFSKENLGGKPKGYSSIFVDGTFSKLVWGSNTCWAETSQMPNNISDS